jgi:hypothetical protein
VDKILRVDHPAIIGVQPTTTWGYLRLPPISSRD